MLGVSTSLASIPSSRAAAMTLSIPTSSATHRRRVQRPRKGLGDAHPAAIATAVIFRGPAVDLDRDIVDPVAGRQAGLQRRIVDEQLEG